MFFLSSTLTAAFQPQDTSRVFPRPFLPDWWRSLVIYTRAQSQTRLLAKSTTTSASITVTESITRWYPWARASAKSCRLALHSVGSYTSLAEYMVLVKKQDTLVCPVRGKVVVWGQRSLQLIAHSIHAVPLNNDISYTHVFTHPPSLSTQDPPP